MPYGLGWFFGERKCCWVLIHLNDGSKIGGIWDNRSFAASYPVPRDLYLSQVCKVTPDGVFERIVDQTNGLWIREESISYIEFFKWEDEQDEKRKKGFHEGTPKTPKSSWELHWKAHYFKASYPKVALGNQIVANQERIRSKATQRRDADICGNTPAVSAFFSQGRLGYSFEFFSGPWCQK